MINQNKIMYKSLDRNSSNYMPVQTICIKNILIVFKWLQLIRNSYMKSYNSFQKLLWHEITQQELICHKINQPTNQPISVHVRAHTHTHTHTEDVGYITKKVSFIMSFT